MKKLQFGRSLIEILAVMVIIGILTLIGFYGLFYAFAKHRANTILHDAYLAYTQHVTDEAYQDDWQEIDFRTESGETLFVKDDEDGDTYVKAEQITGSVCQKILAQASSGRVAFYTPENTPMTKCQKEDNTIIFAFDGLKMPGLNCEAPNDCPDKTTFCDQNEGVCQSCPEGYEVNQEQTRCLIQCDGQTETVCQNPTSSWCCPNTQLCGEEEAECLDSDGNCLYTVQAQTNTTYATCSYMVQPQTKTMHATCSYTIVIGEENQPSTMQVNQGCPSGQYCYLGYTDETCSSAALANSTGLIYGSCHHLSIANKGCPIDSLSSVLAVVDGCPSGQYCYLGYTDETCSSTAPANITGLIYGSCHHLSLSNKGCPISQVGSVMSPVKPCPEAQYCYLKWSNEACEDAPANIQGDIYGTCLAKDSNQAVCPFIPSHL